MNAIAGIIDFKRNLLAYGAYNRLLVRNMICSSSNEPKASEWVGEHTALAGGCPIMKKTVEGHEFVISFVGEIYNSEQLKGELSKYGYAFTDLSDSEIALLTYIHYGSECCKRLDGAYCLAVWDSMRQQAFVCRDRTGAYPLYYAESDGVILFSSYGEGLFEYPGFSAKIDRDGLCELFAGYPSATPEISVFKDVSELDAAHYMKITRSGIFSGRYWLPEIKKHTDSCEKTVEKIYSLINRSAQKILSKKNTSDVFLCCDGADIIFDDGVNFDPFENAGKIIDSLKPVIAKTLDISSYINEKRSEIENPVPISDVRKRNCYLHMQRGFDALNKKAYRLSHKEFAVRSPFSDSEIFQYALNIPSPVKKQTAEDFQQYFRRTADFAGGKEAADLFDDGESAVNLFFDRHNTLRHPEIFNSLSSINDFLKKFNPKIV